jgi:hypothetical protein
MQQHSSTYHDNELKDLDQADMEQLSRQPNT